MTWRSLSLIVVLAVATVSPVSLAAQEAQWPPAGMVRVSPGVVAPVVVKESKPGYTAAAMAAGIQGVVEVEAIILADGKVGDVRVVRSLDREHGLDVQALTAVKQWQFKPGRTKDGKAIPVLVNIEMSFTLRK